MYSLTLFKSIKDTCTDNQFNFDNWEEFEEAMFELAKKPGQKGGPNSSPLMSPAVYPKEEGVKRSNANVLYWSRWCCVDVDDYNTSLDGLFAPLEKYYFLCYSTASSRKNKPKFRIVFPLSDIVPKSKIKHFWHSINNLCLGVNDAQTKDLSRMYYVPAKYPDAYNFIFRNKGEVINTFDIMKQYPWQGNSRKTSFIESLPKGVQKELVEYRKNQLNNVITWSGYRDCPFVPKGMASEYAANAGVKSGGNYFRLYKIMVSVAVSAVENKHPITAQEIAMLGRELDNDCGGIYKERNLEKEAETALEYALKH